MLFDMFGTLVRPVSPDRLIQEHDLLSLKLPSRDLNAATTGFPPAVMLAEMGCTMDDIGNSHLIQAGLSSVDAVIDWIQCCIPDTRPPSPSTISLAKRLTDHCLSELELFSDVEPTLDLLKQRGNELVLVSDLWQPFAKAIDLLDIKKWFSTLYLSYESGFLKRSGLAFSFLPKSRNWTMIGDSWVSDILGARRAGLSACLVDRSTHHPARIILTDIRPLIDMRSNEVRYIESMSEICARWFDTKAEAFEKSPENFIRVREDGTIDWKPFSNVSIVDSLFDLIEK